MFTLAVTPNLVNEENYVMTVEYPEAKKAGKKILPAELVPTDKGELSDKFEGIPDCADAYGVELTDALMRAFEELAIKENDNSPEHNFFIGLAYLGGIDVEVDHERAVKLITSAAEAGLPEAMEKLVSMYRNGEGVERNYHTAIEWQRRLVERYKEIYEDTELEGDAFNYLYTLWDLATMENKENTYILFSEIAIKISNNLKKSFKIKRFIHISYRELGGFYKSDEDKTDIAIEYYLKSFELTRQIALERESVLSYRDHAESLKCLGHLYSSLKKYKLAKKYFETTVEFREVILKIDNNTSTIFELVWALEDLATIQQCYGFPQKSIKTLNKAYELIDNLLKEYPNNNNYLIMHSMVCSDLCFSYKRCGKDRKRKYIEKMIMLENTSISDLEHAFELLPSHELYDAIVLHYYCASLKFDGEHRLNYLKKARNRCIAYCNEYPESEVVSTILTKTDIEIHELQETLSKQKKKKR